MKKYLLLTICMLLVFGQLFAQETTLSRPVPPTRTMKKIGGSMTNQFQTAVREMCNCPLFELNGVLELFAEGAWIEVSTANGNGRTRFKPKDYFETVNSLKCSEDAIYNDMSFEYMPVSPSDAKLSCMDGNCSVSFLIRQTFEGEPVNKRKRKRYCDFTIKKLVVSFWYNEKEELMAKIIGVFVEKTKKCEENEKNTTAAIAR
jgi:hypothetical protein